MRRKAGVLWRASRVDRLFFVVYVGLFSYIAVITINDGVAGNWSQGGLKLALLGAMAAAGWWFVVRFRPRPLRRDLIAAARKMRSGDVWLNRGEHVIITCDRDWLGTHLAVMNEDDFRVIDEEGKGPIVTTTVTIPRGQTFLVRSVDGAVYARDGNTEPPAGWKARWRAGVRTVAMARRGYNVEPDHTDILAIIDWLRNAERIG